MQWLGLAMTILTEPKLLLLDEPTAFLDINRSELLFHIVLRFQKEVDCTIILVSHDAVDDAMASTAHYNEYNLG